MKKYEVIFINQNKKVTVNENTFLSDALRQEGIELDMVCGGTGTCGKCMVMVRKNGEMQKLRACQTKIQENIEIYLEPDKIKPELNILKAAEVGQDDPMNMLVKKRYVQKSDIPVEDYGQYLKSCEIEVLRKFSKYLNDDSLGGITFIESGRQIVDVQPNSSEKILYGAAIDIGTTSVVVYIYDMNRDICIETLSAMNKQISYGADVISRINYCIENNRGAETLHEKIIATINTLLQTASCKITDLMENLYTMIVCGNSVMQHFFLGLSPDRLGMLPFASITKETFECRAEDLKLYAAPKCKVVFLPLIGGYVGADTTSVLLQVPKDDKVRLIIDLGTNGEIAVGNSNRYIVSSTACGPALEGGNIKDGIRACAGAIEKVKIENDVSVVTIGERTPIGICGSGIIDTISELLRNGIIDYTGRMLSRDEYEKISQNTNILMRLTKIEGINSFVLYEDQENQVIITQKDIRQIQLAKSAIYAGSMSLMELYGININSIEEILLSGAFGNYINVDNAVKIGLIPAAGNIRIRQLGNGAGMGVKMYLRNKDMEQECDRIIKNAEHCDLSTTSVFMEHYIQNMNFKKDNRGNV